MIGSRHLDVGLFHLSAALVVFDVLAQSGRGRHVRHLDVRDAALPDRELRVGLLHLLHVVDGYGGIKGLLSRREQHNSSLSKHNFFKLATSGFNDIKSEVKVSFCIVKKLANLQLITHLQTSQQGFIFALLLENPFKSKP